MIQCSHSEFNHPLNYSSALLPDSAYGQVYSTIAMMRQFACEDANSPVFNKALADFQRVNGITEPCKLAFLFAKSLLRFQRDEITGFEIDPDVIEVLIRPVDAVLLFDLNGYKTPGDCDCFSMLVAACLLARDVPCAFVTVAADQAHPDNWSHVYVVAYPGDAERRTPIDASHGLSWGWEARDVSKYTEWPLRGGGTQSAVLLGFLLALGGVMFYLNGMRGR